MANANFDSEPSASGSQPMLSEILDLAPFQVALLDPQLRYKYVNPCFAQFHGYSCDSLLHKTLPATSKAFYEKIQPFLNESLSGKKVTCAIQLLDAQQKPRWLDIKLIPDVDSQEETNGIYCFVSDVTESKESERLTKLVFAHVPAFISLFDCDLKFRFANQSLLDSLGMRMEEVIGRPVDEILDPQSYSVAKKYLLRALEGEESVYENTVTRRDGTELHVLVHLVPEKNSLDETTGVCALLVDTSALIKTQRKLRHNELRIQTAVEGSSVGIIEFDPARPDWVFAEHIESLLGLDRGSLNDSRNLVRERIHPDDMSVNDEARRLEEDGFDTNIEMRLRTSSDDYRWFFINSRFKTNDDGKSKRFIGTISDIDELKKAQLQAAEEVKRRDEFLAMLSHELRNPLAAITFSLDWLQATEDKTLDEKSKKLLEVISRQADHMSKLLQDLLDVTRVTQNRIDYHFVVHDLNQSIRDVVDSILPAITGKYQHLIVNLATEPLMVKGDILRLKQALANLLDNA
jgi:PAS domain S-box-containing protein